MYDLILKNGSVVTSQQTLTADIAVNDGIISKIARDIKEEANRVIDLSGKYIMPGVIDAHIHCMCPFMGCSGPNDFYKTSVAGAFGGVTMMIDFSNSKKGKSMVTAVEEKLEQMSNSAVDFSVHGKLVDGDDFAISEIETLVNMGIPTFKMFMTYRKDGIMCEDETLIKAFRKASEVGAIPLLHCESNAIAEINMDEKISNGKVTWKDFVEAKPPICETEAFSRAYYFAKSTGCAIMAVHTTVKSALEIARQAQSENYPLYVETCPHYLTLYKDKLDQDNGNLWICSPPLRTKDESENLWDGIKDGTIMITGSDDGAYTMEEKNRFLSKDEDGNYIQDFTKVVNGMAGIETRMSILLSEGVSKNRVTLNKIADITSTNIAKIYGMYPQKGEIAVGSDADFAIVDMGVTKTINFEKLHNNLDYSPYEGIETTGDVVMTISKGSVIMENNEFVGKEGAGNPVKRSISKEILGGYSATL
ncbi:MAG: dihydropyrimidinase [Clostridia bacterium]